MVPSAASEGVDLVRKAAAAGQAIYPHGGHTLTDYGLPPTRPGVTLDLTKLTRVIDYPARDMTITVEAGISVAELQRTLAAEGQTLPLDLPVPEKTTLGGAVAANLFGPRRFGHGTLRDYVIGIQFINDQGELCKGGGQVVKNVAGYDLCKLMIGSWGTLGVITQVTLKVKPLPEARAALGASVPLARLASILDVLHASPARPVGIAVHIQGQAGHVELLVLLEESHPAVAWQMEQVKSALRAAGVEADPVAGFDSQLQELANFPLSDSPSWVWQASVLPSRVAEFVSKASSQCTELLAEAGRGTVWGHANTSTPAAVAALRSQAVAGGGSLTVWKAPAEHRTAEVLWGPPQPDWAMMRKVKAALDPQGLFNPGRLFVG